MSITAILLLIAVLVLIGALPVWPYSSKWGPAPSGLAAALLLIIVIVLLSGGRLR